MIIKVNLPEDMEEFENQKVEIMAQFLIDKYGVEKIKMALDKIERESQIDDETYLEWR